MRHFLSLFLFVLFVSASAKNIYVSPGASGQADGSLKHPYSSILEAQLAARAKFGKEEVNIWLLDGTYYLDQPVTFSHEDGGTKRHPVYYRALHEGKAIVSGGRRLEVQW